MEIGKAGRAFLKIAKRRSVKHKPCKTGQHIRLVCRSLRFISSWCPRLWRVGEGGPQQWRHSDNGPFFVAHLPWKGVSQQQQQGQHIQDSFQPRARLVPLAVKASQCCGGGGCFHKDYCDRYLARLPSTARPKSRNFRGFPIFYAHQSLAKWNKKMQRWILTIKIATKQAKVVFQSPYDEAFPTKTL